MSSDFVRYSPEIETIDPNIEELTAQIVDFWEKTVRESPTREGTGHAVRGAHAKTLGVVRAEVEILGDVPAPYAQGIYAKPGRHDALIRFSSANNHLGPDAQLGPVLGFAIKIFDVDGTKLVEDEPDSSTFDLVLKNNPIFVASTAKHYVVLQEVGNDSIKYLARGKTGFRELLTDLLTGKGTFEQSDWAWEEMFAFVKAAQTPVRNPLLSTYWSMAARAARRLCRQGARRPGRGQTPRTRSTANSTSAADRTCSVRRLWMNSRHEHSISIFRSSCPRTSTRCRSTTRPSNGPRSCLRSSPSDECISHARTSQRLRTSISVTRSRSTSGVSQKTTGPWARSCRCVASTARRPRSAGC